MIQLSNPIDEVFDTIFIGSLYGASDLKVLKKAQITTVINVCEHDVPDRSPRYPTYKHFVMTDDLDCGPTVFENALGALLMATMRGGPGSLLPCNVLVNCHMGMSRSASVVATHLARCHKNMLRRAYMAEFGTLDVSKDGNERFHPEFVHTEMFQDIKRAFALISLKRPGVFMNPVLWSAIWRKA